jgi:CBS-domain-containing membrane protein
MTDQTVHPTTSRPKLRRTTVGEVMTTRIISVTPDSGFDDVVRALEEHHVRAVPVIDPAGHLLGVVSEADLMGTVEQGDPEAKVGTEHRGLHLHARRLGHPTTARELMSTPVFGVTPDASIAEAARALQSRKLGWLAVVEPGQPGSERLAGVLTRSDLLAVFVRDDAELRSEIVDTLLARLLLVAPGRVDVRVSDGVVTMTGQVPTRAEVCLLVDFVQRLEGVVAVVDRLTYEVDERVSDAQVRPLY